MKIKKLLSLTIAAAAAMSIMTGCSGGGQESSGSYNGQTFIPGQNGTVSVVPTGIDATLTVTSGAWNNIQWQNFSHQYATLQIPQGWKAEVVDLYQDGSTGSGTMVSVKSPDESVMIAYIDFYCIPQMMMSAPTVESFLTDVVVAANKGKIQNFTITGTTQSDEQKQFMQTSESGAYDAKIITAEHEYNGKPYEGAYSAAITGKNFPSSGVYMAVSPISIDVPRGEMKNWEPVIGKILTSIQLTPACTARYKGVSGGSSGSSGSGSIMDSWNRRSESEDIMSQKRSDATLGQERVVDNYTGEIYKADNGFYEKYSSMGGQRYSPISDSQYTNGYSGYIGF